MSAVGCLDLKSICLQIDSDIAHPHRRDLRRRQTRRSQHKHQGVSSREQRCRPTEFRQLRDSGSQVDHEIVQSFCAGHIEGSPDGLCASRWR